MGSSDPHVQELILAQATVVGAGAEALVLISSAESDEAAIEGLANRFEMSEAAVRSVLELQLRRWLPTQRSMLMDEQNQYRPNRD